MEQQPKSHTGAVQAATTFGRVSHLRVDSRLAQAAFAELQEMGTPQVNLLLLGPDAITQNLLELLLPDLRDPIATWCAGERLTIPAGPEPGTLICYDVGSLTRDDQRRLLDYLGRVPRRPRIISTSAMPMMSRVRTGLFNETLYYRLNTVCLDMNG